MSRKDRRDAVPLYRIAQYREKQGLTQAELAEKAGVSHQTISAYERGERASLRMLGKIARALGVLTHDLLTPRAKGLMTPQECIELTMERAGQEFPDEMRDRLDVLLGLVREEIQTIEKKMKKQTE